MEKFNSKLNILIILGLCFTGLIAFGIYYLNKQELKENTHLSNPVELNFFETAFKFNKKEFNLLHKEVTAGIIPHHLLAADLVAEFFYNLQNKDYEAIVLIGPNHFNSGESDIITSSYDWQTPYGVLECDQNVLRKLMQVSDVKVEEETINDEHSISSEVSFIKKIFPKSKFVPIILKSNVTDQQATTLANKLFELSKNKKMLVLASVDFSHYKDNLTAQEDDKVSISAINNFVYNQIYSLDIDSPASIYALLKFSELGGAKFELLNNSNSALLVNQPDLESTTSYVTGYFIKQNNIRSSLPENEIIENPTRMLFFGDLMLDRSVGTKIEQNGLSYIFGQLDEIDFYDDYDLISANLEGAVTNNGNHYYPEKDFDFAFSPEVIAGLKEYNFNFFNIANNHLDDQGVQGINETRENLDKLGFDYVGCENGIVDDCSSGIVELKDKKIGMIGLSLLGGRVDTEEEKQVVARLKSQSDLVIVNIHWGDEYNTEFNKEQQEIAHDFIDSGADIIIGHHPHVVQGIEVYKNRPIFYSLGNFIFDQYFSSETQKGLAIEVTVRDDKLDLLLHPFGSQNSQVSLMTGEEKIEFLEEISARSTNEKDSILDGTLELNIEN